MDVNRTVGWFTTNFPVYIESSDTKNIERLFIEVQQQIRKIPNKGIGYGILRYGGSNGRQLKNKISPEISFNYLGQIDSGIAEEDIVMMKEGKTGVDIGGENNRANHIEINCQVRGG